MADRPAKEVCPSPEPISDVLIVGRGPLAEWAKSVANTALEAAHGVGPGPVPGTRIVGPADREWLTPEKAQLAMCIAVMDTTLEASIPGYRTWDDFTSALREEACYLVYAIELQRFAVKSITLQSPILDISILLSALLTATGASMDPNIVDRLPPQPKSTQLELSIGEPAAKDELSDRSARMMEAYAKYIHPLQDHLNEGRKLRILWPRELFYFGQKACPPPVIDLTGKARYLYFGPYFPLPAGKWKAALCVGFDRNVSRTIFGVEAFTDKIISRGTFYSEAAGIYRLSLEFTLDTPLEVLQIRLINIETVLEGRMTLIDVELTPAA